MSELDKLIEVYDHNDENYSVNICKLFVELEAMKKVSDAANMFVNNVLYDSAMCSYIDDKLKTQLDGLMSALVKLSEARRG